MIDVDFSKIWQISGPTCPVIVSLKVMPGGIMSMRIIDKASGRQLLPEGPVSRSYGFLPYQCDVIEQVLTVAKQCRFMPGFTEPVARWEVPPEFDEDDHP